MEATCGLCGGQPAIPHAWVVEVDAYTCRHQACDPCLHGLIEEHLPRCRARGQLRVPCFAHGCSGVVCPRELQRVSPAALALSQELAPRRSDLASQLKIERLRRRFAPLLVWGPVDAEQGPSCHHCGEHNLVLLANSGCDHAACEECWVRYAEEQVQDCNVERKLCPTCLAPGCQQVLDQVLWRRVCTRSEVVSIFIKEVDDLLANLRRSVGDFLVVAPQPCLPGPVCPMCHKQDVALLPNIDCGHVACIACWTTWAEDQVLPCRNEHRRGPACIAPQCHHAMSQTLGHFVRKQSKDVSQFASQLDAEVARLKRFAGEMVVFAQSPVEVGPTCSVCGNRNLALISNAGCQHAACEHCWRDWAEDQLEHCRAETMLWPHCFSKQCRCTMASGIWRHACTLSSKVSEFAGSRDSEVERLTRTAGDILTWAPAPSEAGPVCSICRERHFALLSNPECGHGACEDCWSGWAETQLGVCRGARRPVLRCVGHACQHLVAAEVWSHACTRSGAVRSLEDVFVRRRRLQENALYPAAVQVECPRAECLGLGYLGYDSVMCFMCEHQWAADTGESPVDGLGDELVSGGVVKRCPSCDVQIIKNGGCDHMTCKCGHEFWWSTLQPYRTGPQRAR